MKNITKLLIIGICMSSIACVKTNKQQKSLSLEDTSCSTTKSACCNNKKGSESTIKTSVDSKSIYYFHGKRRCNTCLSISKLSREVASKLSTDNEVVVFHEINIDDDKNAELVNIFKVSGSSLYVVDSKGKTTDITSFAFINALNNPEKCKEKIKELL